MPYVSYYMLPEWEEENTLPAKVSCFQGKDETYDYRAIGEAIREFRERTKRYGMTGREKFIFLCKKLGLRPSTFSDIEFY